MSRLDPVAIYFGAVGLIIGGLGMALGLGRDTASEPSTVGMATPIPATAIPADEAVAPGSWRPPLAGGPVAFYGETLELIAPTRTATAPAVPHPASMAPVENRAPDASPPPAGERSAATAHVVVHRRGHGAQVYSVERER